jgi:cytochrome c oxidase cbb3-type subunit I/II
VYDHPFQWGSKRTGPDLAREGVLNPSAAWHYRHMMDPSLVSPKSIMPRYEFLLNDDLDTSTTAAKIRVMQTLGVPYGKDYDQQANADLVKQEQVIAGELKTAKMKSEPNKEIIALIAYLKRLGTDIKANKTAVK